MRPSIATTKSSILRKPSRSNASTRNVSSTVTTIAERQRQAEQQLEPDRRADDLGKVGRKNARFGQQPQADGDRERRIRARQACARSSPAPTPSRAESDCSTIAIRLERTATKSRAAPNLEPPASAVAQLPGSI